MSQTETHFGKLRKVIIPENQTIEEWCKAKCLEMNITELPSYYDDWREVIKDQYSQKYFFIEDEIWEAFEHVECDEGDDINVMNLNKDGTITFVMQFYNGGTCLGEMIEEGLNKINKNKMSEFKQYMRKQIAELRPVTQDDIDMCIKYGDIHFSHNFEPNKVVSISQSDLENGSPKLGDMIARNPNNHNDQWLVNEEYFKENFESMV